MDSKLQDQSKTQEFYSPSILFYKAALTQ